MQMQTTEARQAARKTLSTAARHAVTVIAILAGSALGCSSEGSSNGNAENAGGSKASGGSQAAGSSGMAGSRNGAAGFDGSGSPTGGSEAAGNGAGGSSGTSGQMGGANGTGGAGGGNNPPLSEFSFFVTSMAALTLPSMGGEDGFGGDLSFNGKPGILGADEICRTIAEMSMPGAGVKGWKAFLSTSSEDAIDRIGNGPWYDRLGRVVAMDKQALLNTRPQGADNSIRDDLPNENGVPNHKDRPGCVDDCADNHDTLTGSNDQGRLDDEEDDSSTCNDWTSTTAEGRPRIGHSWPAMSGQHWIAAHYSGGCGPSVHVDAQGGPQPGDNTVGAGGGYGGFYCFASVR